MFVVQRFDENLQENNFLSKDTATKKLEKLIAEKKAKAKSKGSPRQISVITHGKSEENLKKQKKLPGTNSNKDDKELQGTTIQHHGELARGKKKKKQGKTTAKIEPKNPEVQDGGNESLTKQKKRKRKNTGKDVVTHLSTTQALDGVEDTLQNSCNKSLAEKKKKKMKVAAKDAEAELPTTQVVDSVEDKVQNAASYEKRPILEMAKEWELDDRLVTALQAEGIEYFFPIQQQVIPDIISSEKSYHVQQRDICFSAPTGSGKTLVFVLGVLQALCNRRVCRLRALVLLPGRDLAKQVFEVFQTYSKAVGLKVGLATGHSDFLEEQKTLVGPDLLRANPSNGVLLQGDYRNDCIGADHQAILPLSGGHSEVDVLVATPGRLMDHLEKTPGFTLQHLRFLVIDEADRLLTQSYQDWVTKVYTNAYQQKYTGSIIKRPNAEGDDRCVSTAAESLVANATTVRSRPLVASAPGLPVALLAPAPLRKLLSSATLTTSPEKLATLGLIHPRIYSLKCTLTAQVQKNEERFQLPDGLIEKCYVCSAEEKPLVLIYLLKSLLESSLVVIFTSSVDTTHRLARLLQLYGGFHGAKPPAEFSGTLNQKQRNKLIKQCKSGTVKVLVSSDGMARGMDIPDVDYVINYDMPLNPRTYVHRVGRTARAGRSGTTMTLLKPGQEKVFRRMHNNIGAKEEPNTFPVASESLDEYKERCSICLHQLEEILKNEKQGKQKRIAAVCPIDIKNTNIT